MRHVPTLTLSGRAFHYEESGPAAAPALVLLHPFPLSGASFQGLRAALSGRHRILTPDLRGFGGSARGPGSVATMSEMAEDVLAFLDALGIESAVVGGCSMGGYVTLALLRLDPTRVAGLVLMSTHARPDDEAGRAARESTALRLLESGTEVLVTSLLPRLLSPGAPESLRDSVAAMIRQGDALGDAAATRGMAVRDDTREILSRYAGPALVLSGGQDPIASQERVRELAELVPGADYRHLPEAGHLLFLEAPDAVRAAIQPFLDSLTS